MRRMRRARFGKLALQAVTAGGVLLTVCLGHAGIEIRSDSLLRIMERGAQGAQGKLLVPGYEYLQVDLGALEGDGFSFHGYGWGRYNFGEGDVAGGTFEDRSAGEILYGYLEYFRSDANAFARVGRQNVFNGASNLSLDGVRVGSDLTEYFSAEAWAGQPVAAEVANGRSGDRAWGGRVGHQYKAFYTVGLSYKKLDDDSDRQLEILAVDSSLRPAGSVSITGYSARNLRTDAWQEHSYDARVHFKPVRVGFLFRHFELQDLLDRGTFNAAVLTSQRLTGDRLTQWGADLVTRPDKKGEVGLRYLRTHSDLADRDADRVTALGVLHGKELTQAGAEVGRQFGDVDATTFWLARAYFYWQHAPSFLSGDVVYARYDQAIFDERSSLFASLGAGSQFLKGALELRVTGDYSRDPFFDSDVRGIASATYKFSR